MEKIRLDIMLVNKGLAVSRQAAQRLISDGKVLINGIVQTKSSKLVSEIDIIEAEEEKYVSRGAYKLEKALNEFGICVNGLKFMDCGASTGGFTDCLLQNGAECVWAVDVGTSQLADKLKNDKRVISIENTNIRYIDKFLWMDDIDCVVIDVSFISLKIILKRLFDVINEKAFFIALIKPQFEAGRDKLNKNGIVKDKKTHIVVINNIINFILQNGYSVKNITFSPVKGGDGNIEYLILFDKNMENVYNSDNNKIEDVVDTAFSALKKEDV